MPQNILPQLKEDKPVGNLPPEPSITEDDDTPIKFDQFSNLSEIPFPKEDENTDDKQTDKKIDEGKTDDKSGDPKEDKTLLKSDDKEIDTKVEDKVVIPPIGNQPPKPGDISFEGLSEIDQKYLKQMSKEAREHVASHIKEKSKVKEELKAAQTEISNLKNTGDGKLPQNYLEHPEAYIFNPKYQEASVVINRAQYEIDHYRKQVELIREGKKWRDLNYDGKSGRYSLGAEQDATTFAENDLSERILNGKLLLQDQTKIVEHIAHNHVNEHKQYVGQFRQMEDHYFPGYKEGDKTEGDAGKYITTINKALAERGQQYNPLSGMLAKMYAYLMESSKHIKNLESQIQKGGSGTQNNNTNGKERQPNSGDINSGGGGRTALTGSDEEKVSFKEFEKYKRD